MGAELDSGARVVLADQVEEGSLALQERPRTQVASVQMKQVESIKDQAVGDGRDLPSESPEVGSPLRILDDDLAIYDRGLAIEPARIVQNMTVERDQSWPRRVKARQRSGSMMSSVR